ncbi:MAG: hypothetical protein KF796_12750 [Ramlibacter sp.]|nr:hypothetical protein [Ramlibacter sp.]
MEVVMSGSAYSSAFRCGGAVDTSAARLCLHQATHELHQLRAGERAAPDDLVLHHLRGPGEIDTIRFLRGHIDLTHSASDPHFATDEKKEMK